MLNIMDKNDVFCFYGFGSCDCRKEKFSVKDVVKRVREYQQMFCTYPFVLIYCPSLDCCWIKDYATLGVKSFQKFRDVFELLGDYPFLKDLYEKAN